MPISFSCPHCGKQTVVSDQFAGQSGPCAGCGQQVTIPAAEVAAAARPAGSTNTARSSAGTAIAVGCSILLVVLLLCGGLAAVGGRAMFVASLRERSMNNLKQLGLALHMYHDTHRSFPPAVVTDAGGKPLYSGRVLLLPFLERDDLYQAFDKSKAWDSPENAAITAQLVSTFVDPASQTPGASNYVFVTGPGTIFEGNQAVNFASITDGTSNTLMMVETSTGPASWAAPQEWDASTGQFPPGHHGNVVLVLFADGSVRALNPNNVGSSIRQLTIRNDGEATPQF